LKGHGFAIAFLLGGFLLNFLPFIAIRRVMYLYHYFFALVWLVLLAVMSLGVAAGWNDGEDDALWSFPTARSRVAYWTVAAVVLIGLVYFSPFTFGLPLSAWSYDAASRWVLHPQF
jgi:dolichyl-phosphate-mannose--protein O-mannosyl transferase